MKYVRAIEEENEYTLSVKSTVLHLNQGSSYTPGVFNDHLASNGIKHSMLRPETPGVLWKASGVI